MKNRILFFIVTLFALFLTSCSSNMMTGNRADLNVKATSALEADIKVENKIQGEATTMYLFNFIPLKFRTHATEGIISPSYFELLFGSYNTTKHEAAYNAVKENDADVIVDPRYEIEYQNFILWGVENCVVNGYKGTITGFENVDSKNVMTIKDNRK